MKKQFKNLKQGDIFEFCGEKYMTLEFINHGRAFGEHAGNTVSFTHLDGDDRGDICYCADTEADWTFEVTVLDQGHKRWR